MDVVEAGDEEAEAEVPDMEVANDDSSSAQVDEGATKQAATEKASS